VAFLILIAAVKIGLQHFFSFSADAYYSKKRRLRICSFSLTSMKRAGVGSSN
jgi:hypothetical protein